VSEYSTCCTCGTKWLTGQNGRHSCIEKLQDEIIKLHEDYKTQNNCIVNQLDKIVELKAHIEQLREFLIGTKKLPHCSAGIFNTIDVMLEITPAQSLTTHDKDIAVRFFHHWWNSGGTNTEQGFDDWYAEQLRKDNDGS
jgi:hypothetical protein